MMADKEQKSPRRNICVATVGRLGHGKTTLTAALHRVSAEMQGKPFELDKIPPAKEESKLDITFTIARSEYQSDTCRYTHIDCPTRADYMKSLLSGAAKIDGAILVFSTADYPDQETLEILQLCTDLNVSAVVVFINAKEGEDERLSDLYYEIMLDVVNKNFLQIEKTGVFVGSAACALEGNENNGKSTAAVKDLLTDLDFHIPGLRPAFDRFEPPTIDSHTAFKARVYFLAKDDGGCNATIPAGYNSQVRFQTTDVAGTCEALEGSGTVEPGEYALLRITLDEAVAMEWGTRFTLREDGRAIGVGMVTDIIK